VGDHNLREKLSSISVPALVIHGRHDAISLSSAEKIARLLGADMQVFEDSRHVPYVEEPNNFAAALNAFLPCQP